MTPTTCEGNRCSNGKRNPVRLVRTVVTRKIAVQPARRFPVSSPYRTMNPEPIPTRLINTCNRVNVDIVIPRIMTHLLFLWQDSKRQILPLLFRFCFYFLFQGITTTEVNRHVQEYQDPLQIRSTCNSRRVSSRLPSVRENDYRLQQTVSGQ